MAVDNALPRSQQSGSYGTPLWVLVASLVGLVVAAFGVVALIDKKGGGMSILAWFYDQVGNPVGATALRNGGGDQFYAKVVLAVVALYVGVVGVWLLFTSLSTIAERLRPKLRDRHPALDLHRPRPLLLLAIYLVYPAVGTVIQSFQDDEGAFTLANWAILGQGAFLEILRNNVIWLVVATAGSVGLGLLVAALFDRIRRESLAKIFIFTPAGDLARRRDRHLEVRLRAAAAEPAAVRAPERDLDRLRQQAGRLGDDRSRSTCRPRCWS